MESKPNLEALQLTDKIFLAQKFKHTLDSLETLSKDAKTGTQTWVKATLIMFNFLRTVYPSVLSALKLDATCDVCLYLLLSPLQLNLN